MVDRQTIIACTHIKLPCGKLQILAETLAEAFLFLGSLVTCLSSASCKPLPNDCHALRSCQLTPLHDCKKGNVLQQVFCEEAGSDAGYFRQFVSASYGRFWARYAPRLGQRPHCYEVCSPALLFFWHRNALFQCCQVVAVYSNRAMGPVTLMIGFNTRLG